MECRSVLDSLSDYLDGALSAQQVQSIEIHLHQCSPCNTIKSDLGQICVAAKELPLRTPSRALWTRIQNEIELDANAPGKAEVKQAGFWKSWSERKFTFSLPQLAGASALAFSLMVFGMYHALHRDPQVAEQAAAQAVLPGEAEWQSKIQQKMQSLNVRRAAWTPTTSATYDNHIQRIETSMSRVRQTLISVHDTEQEKLLLDLYNEKLQLMEDFEKFEK